MHVTDIPGGQSPTAQLRSADGGCVIEYYTSQPAPSQWIAVGLARLAGRGEEEPRWMVVGTGRTEATAIMTLRRRCPRSTSEQAGTLAWTSGQGTGEEISG